MVNKKLIYVDMDDCIADFRGHSIFKDGVDISYMYEKGFFLSLDLIKGALVAVRALILMGYDVQILTQPVAESAHSYSEKVQWIGKHFPELVTKINMTQNKGFFKGDYLIDDNLPKWKDKFEANGGKFIHYDYHGKDHEEAWMQIVSYFKLQKELCPE